MVCPKCNMNMSENTRFCTHCGTPNPKFDTNINTNNTTMCIRCNTQVSNVSKFCGACGTPNPNYNRNLKLNTSGEGTKPKKSFWNTLLTIFLIIFGVCIALAILGTVLVVIVIGACFSAMGGL